jgi:hypothetical protein
VQAPSFAGIGVIDFDHWSFIAMLAATTLAKWSAPFVERFLHVTLSTKRIRRQFIVSREPVTSPEEGQRTLLPRLLGSTFSDCRSQPWRFHERS